jgi:hypothetical protein
MLAPQTEQSYRSIALTKAVQQTRAEADAVVTAMGVNITGVKEVVIGCSLPPVVYDTTRSLNKDSKWIISNADPHYTR